MLDRSELIELHNRLSKTLDEERELQERRDTKKDTEQLEKILMI